MLQEYGRMPNNVYSTSEQIDLGITDSDLKNLENKLLEELQSFGKKISDTNHIICEFCFKKLRSEMTDEQLESKFHMKRPKRSSKKPSKRLSKKSSKSPSKKRSKPPSKKPSKSLSKKPSKRLSKKSSKRPSKKPSKRRSK